MDRNTIIKYVNSLTIEKAKLLYKVVKAYNHIDGRLRAHTLEKDIMETSGGLIGYNCYSRKTHRKLKLPKLDSLIYIFINPLYIGINKDENNWSLSWLMNNEFITYDKDGKVIVEDINEFNDLYFELLYRTEREM